MDVGAPLPRLVANEHTLTLSFYVLPQDGPADFNKAVQFDLSGVRRFAHVMDGEDCGFLPQASHEVWVRDGGAHKHLVFAFHDSSFEVICGDFSFEVVEVEEEEASS